MLIGAEGEGHKCGPYNWVQSDIILRDALNDDSFGGDIIGFYHQILVMISSF